MGEVLAVCLEKALLLYSMRNILNKKVLQERPEGYSPMRAKLHEVIFEAETPAGKAFDVVLLIMIMMSILTVMLETVPALYAEYKTYFILLEWTFTIFFTIEYFLRVYCVVSAWGYMKSFYGMVDLLSILPSYLTLFFPGVHTLMIIRGLRLIRVFRIFKLDSFIDQGNIIINALIDSQKKIIFFSTSIIIIVSIFGCIMYLVEHPVNEGFTSIPESIYWAIVTITTVGYGDISPVTGFGKFLASVIMMMGYVIIAIPTGIVTSSIIQQNRVNNTITCPQCSKEGHEKDALYCNACGHML